MTVKNLSKKEHWDNVYKSNGGNLTHVWKPTNYNSLVLEHILFKTIDMYNPKSILEIGCGDSTWLSYIAKEKNIIVAGIDYSEKGCELARERLKNECIEGKIFCENIFKANPKLIGQFDFVYSLGVIEHFSDIQIILDQELKFVKHGGILFTEIPNFNNSIHSFLSFIYQPKLLAMHKKISSEQLIQAYQNLGLEEIECNYTGLFSFTIVAWGKYPRWPKLSNIFLSSLLFFIWYIDFFLSKTKCYLGFAPFAPFIYITGRKK
jgi:2-polyprenyl-6-hydroxyphenyl methylase/3-demethylubiquinone-9 3-methyltransferase